MFKVHRYHDICAGHRVVGHENKCRHLHGHNYRIHFVCETEGLDELGRAIDFSVVKEKLCMWVEEHWDHKFLHWSEDPMIACMSIGYSHYVEEACGSDAGFHVGAQIAGDHMDFLSSLVPVPFNPTAENMAKYLVDVVGPMQLDGTGVVLTEVKIEETAKCHASYGV